MSDPTKDIKYRGLEGARPVRRMTRQEEEQHVRLTMGEQPFAILDFAVVLNPHHEEEGGGEMNALQPFHDRVEAWRKTYAAKRDLQWIRKPWTVKWPESLQRPEDLLDIE